jgi:uncharacterized protein (TIGR02757 family)
VETNKYRLSFDELRTFLEDKHDQYNRPSFIETDPIQIAHKFTKKEDIEIISFLTCQIAWGNRKTIINNAELLSHILGDNPYEFVLHADNKTYSKLRDFKHRTFNREDLVFFLKSLKNIYLNHKGLENVFLEGYKQDSTIYNSIAYFRDIFMQTKHEKRSEKHIANVLKKSAAKRINLFLMWMVRNDTRGVHFGLWQGIPASALMLPLDVHVGKTARILGLLKRKQNDWMAVEEITAVLRNFDPNDPTKYDFALFGLGVFEKFGKI